MGLDFICSKRRRDGWTIPLRRLCETTLRTVGNTPKGHPTSHKLKIIVDLDLVSTCRDVSVKFGGVG